MWQKVEYDQIVRLDKTSSSPREHKLRWSDRGDTKVHHKCWQMGRKFQERYTPRTCILHCRNESRTVSIDQLLEDL